MRADDRKVSAAAADSFEVQESLWHMLISVSDPLLLSRLLPI